MNNLYPYDQILKIMKPCKTDARKEAHRRKLTECLTSTSYVWDEKIDGIHINSIGGRLFSIVQSKATGWPSEKTHHCPHLSEALQQFSSQMVLDGELYLPGGKSNDVVSISNSEVQLALQKQKDRGLLRYRVYDILRDIDGTLLTAYRWCDRRDILTKRMKDLALEYAELHPFHECATTNAMENFERIVANGGEGIVLKNKYAQYYPGKRPMWNQIKVKASTTDDVIIIGFTAATKVYTGKNLDKWPYWEDEIPVTSNYYNHLIGAIEVGKYKNGQIVSVGTVTGITDALRMEFTEYPEKYLGRVIKIKAMEVFESGGYRHANFAGFHDDKNAEECMITDIMG